MIAANRRRDADGRRRADAAAAAAHRVPAAAAARRPGSGAAGAAQRGPTVEWIAQAIAAAIVDKRLPPGTWLREEALGRVYSVSRTKVRSALLMLSRDKLVETIPDKGTFVSRPSAREAREIFALRRLLEGEVVRLFIARAGPADYAVLDRQIRIERATLRASTAGAEREKLLGDFHLELARLAGNEVLAETVRELVARSSLISMLYQSTNDPQCSSDEHERLLRICRSGRAAAAVAEMVAHLARVEASLELDQDLPDRRPDLVKALLM